MAKMLKIPFDIREDEDRQSIMLMITAYSNQDDGSKTIGASCMTSQEWDYEINDHIKRLERLRVKGKRILDKLWKEGYRIKP